MKKFFLFLITLSSFLFTACSPLSHSMIHSRLDELNNSQAEKLAQNQLDAIRSAINAKDTEAIKTLFAPTVEDNINLDEGISQLISLLYNRIDLVEQLGGNEHDSNNYGDIISTYTYDFSVTTEEMDYVLSISGCNEDYRSSDNVGMTRIVVRPSSLKQYPDEIGDMGIYIYEQ